MREYTFRTDGCSNTITTVQKDNYIAEIFDWNSRFKWRNKMKTRLIDADKLVDSLRASMNHGRETFPLDLIVEAIDEQPTTKYIEQISRDDIEDMKE